jgi:hypothetical protein
MLTRDVGATREIGVVAGCDAPEVETGGTVTTRLGGAAFDAGDDVGPELEADAPFAAGADRGADAVGGLDFDGSAARRTGTPSDAATVLGGVATCADDAVVSTIGALVVSAARATGVSVALLTSPDAETGSVGGSRNRDASFDRARIAVPITASSTTPSNAPPANTRRRRGRGGSIA